MTETTTAAAAFDAEKFKKTTRAQWESAAEAWDRWGPLVGRWLGPATDAMLGALADRLSAGNGECLRFAIFLRPRLR